jgi:glutamyl-tRNA(Gln) amidotransferase subunit D
MGYPARVEQLLKRHGVTVGDEVRVHLSDAAHEGIVMPHHAFSGEDVLTIKLTSNGYNVGLKTEDITGLELVAHRPRADRPAPRLPEAPDKPLIAFLSTGGTIASYVDYRTGAVHPSVTAEDLVFTVPELAEVGRLRARALYQILSEDMRVEIWQHLAREVGQEFKEGASAVVIPHGTDTLGVTSAALALMLRDLPGPVAVVGAQRSPDRPSSDAYLNLLCAARLASTDLGEVVVVLHGDPSDTHCDVHRGTKVRKMHSSRRDAFRSINLRPLGRVHADGRVEWTLPYRKRSGPVRVDERMEPNVSLVQFYPGMKAALLEAHLRSSKGVVIAGTGLGHVATNLIPSVRSAIASGVHVVMATQTLYGRTNMLVYSTGRDLLDAGVIPAEDMLPETALVKLMWVLGHTTKSGEVWELMARDLVGEMNPALKLQDYEGEDG